MDLGFLVTLEFDSQGKGHVADGTVVLLLILGLLDEIGRSPGVGYLLVDNTIPCNVGKLGRGEP